MTRFHLEHRIPTYYCNRCDTFHLGVDLGSCIGGIGFEWPASHSKVSPEASGDTSAKAAGSSDDAVRGDGKRGPDDLHPGRDASPE